MIHDVKSYFNTVGKRISGAFSMDEFHTEKESEFWSLAAEHMSRKTHPSFSDIASWMDLMYSAAAHFVYKKKEEKLVLYQWHVISRNITKGLKNAEKDDDLKSAELKEFKSGFEHQLQNLEKTLAWHEEFTEWGSSNHTIGQCIHIPIHTHEGEVWGVYFAGPYVQTPERMLAKVSIIARLLSKWFIEIEHDDQKSRAQYSQKAHELLGELGTGTLNAKGISEFILRYAVHFYQASGGAVFLKEDEKIIEVSSFEMNQGTHSKLLAYSNEHFFDKIVPTYWLPDNWVESLHEPGFNRIAAIPFKENEHHGLLYLGFEAVPDENMLEKTIDFIRIISGLYQYQNINRSFSDQLLQTYYQMLRQVERLREKTQHHTPRMMAFIGQFGMLFGLTEEESEILTQTAQLHDIGYVGTLSISSDKSLASELNHPVVGALLVEHLPIHEDVKQGILTHHEWVNGKGTPVQLTGDNIPWTGKIIGLFEFVVDFIESHHADTSHSPDEWLEILKNAVIERADQQFDMVIVPTAVQLIEMLGWDGCCTLGVE